MSSMRLALITHPKAANTRYPGRRLPRSYPEEAASFGSLVFKLVCDGKILVADRLGEWREQLDTEIFVTVGPGTLCKVVSVCWRSVSSPALPGPS